MIKRRVPYHLIVHTSWYKEDIAKMIEIAEKQLGEDTSLLSVPGSLELAAGAKRYIENLGEGVLLRGIIFCGIVIRGETSHYDLVTQETFRAIGNLALEFPHIYMVNNVICVENKEQLIERLEKNTVNNSIALIGMTLKDLYNEKPSQT
ncbi:6,7-dimethyl-8-ribityllumazine synthase [SAR86 cluster bacterium]|nr:6,7-dimethyl-8-ribityllumazine synthase [SAR86 cluster bacterium]